MFVAKGSIEAGSFLAVAFGALGLIALVMTKYRSKPGTLNHSACFAFHFGWMLAALFIGSMVFGLLPRALGTDSAGRVLWCCIGTSIVFGAIAGTCGSLVSVVPTVLLSSTFACVATANATGSRHWFDPTTVIAGLGVGAVVIVVQWLRLRNE